MPKPVWTFLHSLHSLLDLEETSKSLYSVLAWLTNCCLINSLINADILGRSSWVMQAITVSVVIACMRLKHNSCRMWPSPCPSVICVELIEHSSQPITGGLATHPNDTLVKIYRYVISLKLVLIKVNLYAAWMYLWCTQINKRWGLTSYKSIRAGTDEFF